MIEEFAYNVTCFDGTMGERQTNVGMAWAIITLRPVSMYELETQSISTVEEAK
jgi:hypothetical protein